MGQKHGMLGVVLFLLARIREPRGNAGLTNYRETNGDVRSPFAIIERANLVEAYGDLTSAIGERLQKLRGQPVLADLLQSTYIEGLPQDPPATEGTAQKGTSRASRFCFLPLELALFGHSDPPWVD
ncbi:unnamed protein product [Rangifer tarandus platyrhynchus]|uniref:Uncharacterized protein n=2 Tax=Rangifer tarandus platyrhynchus TaxID=3082113 RepID=A0ABN8ZNE9_RANTA|nr:unnamed protein product [Rangifer tarandus platyrhynchus]CAI9709870.1 unnamed protein product [Rangifer tarandus platyrhynchus]